MESIVSLFFFLLLAVWQDYHTQKISNSLIITALLGAILSQIRQNGFQSILPSVNQAFIIILILFPFYLCKALGAGDLKLLGVTAVFLSWRQALMAFLSGMFFALVPVFFLLFGRKKCMGNKIPMSGPFLGGILLTLYLTDL